MMKSRNKLDLSFWLFCYILSTSLFFYAIYNSIVEFFEYHVISRSRFVYEKESDFPGVAICHTNPIVTNYSIDLLIEYLENETKYSYVNQSNLTKLDFLNQVLYNDKAIKFNIRSYLMNLNETEKKTLGFTAEEMIVDCIFTNTACSHRDFIWHYHLDHGNCYVFNSKNKLKICNSGMIFLFLAQRIKFKNMCILSHQSFWS